MTDAISTRPKTATKQAAGKKPAHGAVTPKKPEQQVLGSDRLKLSAAQKDQGTASDPETERLDAQQSQAVTAGKTQEAEKAKDSRAPQEPLKAKAPEKSKTSTQPQATQPQPDASAQAIAKQVAAVGSVLSGTPAAFPLADGTPVDFSVKLDKPHDPNAASSLDEYKVTVSGRVFYVELPPDLDPKAPIAQVIAKDLAKPAQVLDRQQIAAVGSVLGGTAAPFPLADGTKAEFSAKLDKPHDPADATSRDHYQVTVGGQTIGVQMPPDLDPKAPIARFIAMYLAEPAHLRDALMTLRFDNNPNPLDSQWGQTYHMGGFTSAATAGQGLMTFWNVKGEQLTQLKPAIFHHELAHLFGERLAVGKKDNADMIPAGWEDAAKADGKFYDDYASKSPNEDFAETWQAFMTARSHGDTALKQFREDYPHRMAIVDAIAENTYKKP